MCYTQPLLLSEGFAMSKILPSYKELMKGQEPFILSVSLNHDGSILLLGFNVEWNGTEYIAKYDIKNDTIEIFDNPSGVTLHNPIFHPTEDWFALRAFYGDRNIQTAIMDLQGKLFLQNPEDDVVRAVEAVSPDGRILFTKRDEWEPINPAGFVHSPFNLYEASFDKNSDGTLTLYERQLTNFEWPNTVMYANYFFGGDHVIFYSQGLFGEKRPKDNNYPLYVIRDIDKLTEPLSTKPEVFWGKAKLDNRNIILDGSSPRYTTDRNVMYIRINYDTSADGSGLEHGENIARYYINEDKLEKVSSFFHYMDYRFSVSGDGNFAVMYSAPLLTDKVLYPNGRLNRPESSFNLYLLDMRKPLPITPDKAFKLDIKDRLIEIVNNLQKRQIIK